MKIATLTESSENENRVAITPDSAKFLIKFGHEVIIQSGAGEKARFSKFCLASTKQDIIRKFK